MGFEAQFVANVDKDWKNKVTTKENRGMNFKWKVGLGSKFLFTSVLKDACYPAGTFSDATQKGDSNPFVSDFHRLDYNAPDRSTEFVNYILEASEQIREQNLLVPMGCDFTYENAGQNFLKMESMLSYLH